MPQFRGPSALCSLLASFLSVRSVRFRHACAMRNLRFFAIPAVLMSSTGMKEFSSAVVSAVPSGSEHDLAGSRRNALRTMHTTAIFDSIAVSRWSADSLGPDFADWFLVCEISGLPIWGFVRRVVSSDVNRAFRANGFWVP